jgi:hypothetical protein
MRKNAYTAFSEPILSTLDQIEERDALLNKDGTEAEWPAADVIIGNPPFLGGKWMLEVLGKDKVARLRSAFSGRVPSALCREAPIFDAWSDEAWVLAGADVRVSMVCFGARPNDELRLDGSVASAIHPDLTSWKVDLTSARSLAANVAH